MTPLPTASTRPSTPTGEPIDRATPRANQPAAMQHGAGRQFGQALSKLEREAGSAADAKPDRQGERAATARTRIGPTEARPSPTSSPTHSSTPKRREEERRDGAGAPTPPASLSTTGPAQPAAAPPALPDTAALDRMAAAIAEVRGDAGSEVASVRFAPGGVVEGATVSRDATGALTVRLTGWDPRVARLSANTLVRDLRVALGERGVRVREVQLAGDRRVKARRPTVF